MQELYLTNLPWPPSLNKIYIPCNAGIILDPRAKKYKNNLALICKNEAKKQKWKKLENGVGAVFTFYQPDNRKHDIDNLFKLIKDALELAEIYTNDNNIVREFSEKIFPLEKHAGYVNIRIFEAEKFFL